MPSEVRKWFQSSRIKYHIIYYTNNSKHTILNMYGFIPTYHCLRHPSLEHYSNRLVQHPGLLQETLNQNCKAHPKKAQNSNKYPLAPASKQISKQYCKLKARFKAEIKSHIINNTSKVYSSFGTTYLLRLGEEQYEEEWLLQTQDLLLTSSKTPI